MLQASCAVKADRTVACWGNVAPAPADLTSVAQVDGGVFHTCALKTDGTVVCWGRNAEGQATVPTELPSEPICLVSLRGLGYRFDG